LLLAENIRTEKYGPSADACESNCPQRFLQHALYKTEKPRMRPGSEPGKVVAEAGRSGRQWFVAAINGGDATTLDVTLNFLGAGSWQSTQLLDAKDKPDA
jgi:hypothetical protein